MFVFVKRYMKRTAPKIVFIGVWSLILTRTSSPFSSKVWKYHQNCTLFHPEVNHEWTLNKSRISSWIPWVSGSCQAKNIQKKCLAFSLLFDCNAAWTGFLTKYSEFDTYYSIFGKKCLVFGNIVCCPLRMYCLAPYTVPLGPNCPWSGVMLGVPCHVSCVTRHFSNYRCQLCQVSPVTASVMCHMLAVMRHISIIRKGPDRATYCLLVRYHLSLERCHVAHVQCQLSTVRCQVSNVR